MSINTTYIRNLSEKIAETIVNLDQNDLTNKNKLIDLISITILNYDNNIKQLNDFDVNAKIQMFLSAKKLEGLSDNTIKSYKIELNIFKQRINKKLHDINSNDIREYLFQFSYLKNSSLATKLYILRSFFNWLFNEELIEKNPTNKIKLPKKDNLLPQFLEIDELEMIREACQSLRERALIEIMYATGCRLSEIVNININDINWSKRSIRIIGKGSKERIVFLNYKAVYYLKKYLNSRNDMCGALFVTERKPYHRLGQRSVQREIKNIAKRTEINKNVHPHMFRHSFASSLIQNGADVVFVQEMLGHSNLDTTRRYISIDETYKKYNYNKYLTQ